MHWAHPVRARRCWPCWWPSCSGRAPTSVGPPPVPLLEGVDVTGCDPASWYVSSPPSSLLYCALFSNDYQRLHSACARGGGAHPRRAAPDQCCRGLKVGVSGPAAGVAGAGPGAAGGRRGRGQLGQRQRRRRRRRLRRRVQPLLGGERRRGAPAGHRGPIQAPRRRHHCSLARRGGRREEVGLAWTQGWQGVGWPGHGGKWALACRSCGRGLRVRLSMVPGTARLCCPAGSYLQLVDGFLPTV
jgi:hypothetical protein